MTAPADAGAIHPVHDNPGDAGAIHPVHENPAPAFGTGMALPPRGLLELLDPPPLKKRRPPSGCAGRGPVEKKVRAALLSRALERSVIAAGGLNGRVRDGNGCHTPAGGTNQEKEASGTGRPHPGAARARFRPIRFDSIRFRFASPPPPRAFRARRGREASRPHGRSEAVG